MERHHLVSKTRPLLIAPVVFLSVFFVVPVANTILRYFRFSEFSSVLDNQSLRGVAWFSLWQAVVSTIATLAIGRDSHFVGLALHAAFSPPRSSCRQ
jgi:ABC-type Fe3+ transport system permease subunit